MVEIICACFRVLTTSRFSFCEQNHHAAQRYFIAVREYRAGSKRAFSEIMQTDAGAGNGGRCTAVLKETARQLKLYFDGKLTEFDIPLDPDGSAFQKKVWAAMSSIPYGTMWSYKELAKNIGHPNAARAVGTANARCNVWVIIPCHRVISSSGSIGGYGSEPEIKQRLLDLEKASPSVPAFLP